MPTSRSKNATSRPFKEVRRNPKELKPDLTIGLIKVVVVLKVLVMHGGKLANVNSIPVHSNIPTTPILRADLQVLDAKVKVKEILPAENHFLLRSAVEAHQLVNLLVLLAILGRRRENVQVTLIL